jgi:hypothetical protein
MGFGFGVGRTIGEEARFSFVEWGRYLVEYALLRGV